MHAAPLHGRRASAEQLVSRSIIDECLPSARQRSTALLLSLQYRTVRQLQALIP
jgi:hypothetical protein